MRDLDSNSQPHASNAVDEDLDRTLREDLKRLSEEAKAYAEAELQFQKSRTVYAASAIKSVIAFVLVALVLLFFSGMALIMGLILALTPLITAWGAMALVTFALLVIAIVMVLQAKKRLSVISRVFSQGANL